MPFQKVEFEFPHDEENELNTEIEIEPSSEVEVDLSGNGHVSAPEPEPEPELEIIDDTPKKDRNRTPSEPPEDVTDEELQNYSDKVQKRIRHFSKGYHDERRAKESAERERDELQRAMRGMLEEKNALQDTVTKNQQVLYEQAKHSVAGELSQAKEAFKVAHESGDSEAFLNAQERFTNAKLKAERITSLEEPAEVDNTTSVQQVAARNEQAAPDPKAVAWRSENTWFGNANHEPETAFALGLHKQLTETENVAVSSDEYYEKINTRMQSTFPELFRGVDEQEVRTPRSKPDNVVAPATRSTAPKKIRLTQTQLALSKRLGLTPAQYAKQVAIDMRNSNG